MRKRVIGFLLVIALCLTGCAPKPVSEGAPVQVYYAGEQGGVQTALELAQQAGTVTLVGDLAEAQTLVLNGAIPPGAAERVADGAGLVLILGEDTSQADIQELLGEAVSLSTEEEALSLVGVEGLDDPLLQEIVWNSAPQVRERSRIEGLAPLAESLVIRL